MPLKATSPFRLLINLSIINRKHWELQML